MEGEQAVRGHECSMGHVDPEVLLSQSGGYVQFDREEFAGVYLELEATQAGKEPSTYGASENFRQITRRGCEAEAIKGSFIEKGGFQRPRKEWIEFRKSEKVEEAAEM